MACSCCCELDDIFEGMRGPTHQEVLKQQSEIVKVPLLNMKMCLIATGWDTLHAIRHMCFTLSPTCKLFSKVAVRGGAGAFSAKEAFLTLWKEATKHKKEGLQMQLSVERQFLLSVTATICILVGEALLSCQANSINSPPPQPQKTVERSVPKCVYFRVCKMDPVVLSDWNWVFRLEKGLWAIIFKNSCIRPLNWLTHWKQWSF